MGAGDLDRRIAFYAEQTTRSDSGAIVTVWALQFTVWGEVNPESGSEVFASSSQRSAKQSTIFRVRYRAGITPKMRIRYEGAEYDIEDIQSPDRRRYLYVKAVAHEVSPGAS